MSGASGPRIQVISIPCHNRGGAVATAARSRVCLPLAIVQPLPLAWVDILIFPAVCRAAKLPEPVPEFRFAPPRRWRFDWCWPAYKLALEVQGGLFVQGRHSRGAALLKEHEKLNTAAQMGWRVLYVTPKQLLSDGPELVRRAMSVARPAVDAVDPHVGGTAGCPRA